MSAPVLLTRPFTGADFMVIRDLQIDGASLREIAMYTERSASEVNLALDIKLGRSPDEAAAIVNERFAVRPACPAEKAPSPKGRIAAAVGALFGPRPRS
jgi:hypothetical protein